MSVADRLRAEGMEKGMEQGWAEGMEQGRAAGELLSKLKLARKLLQRGMSLAEAADLVELDEPMLEKLLDDHSLK